MLSDEKVRRRKKRREREKKKIQKERKVGEDCKDKREGRRKG